MLEWLKPKTQNGRRMMWLSIFVLCCGVTYALVANGITIKLEYGDAKAEITSQAKQ